MAAALTLIGLLVVGIGYLAHQLAMAPNDPTYGDADPNLVTEDEQPWL